MRGLEGLADNPALALNGRWALVQLPGGGAALRPLSQDEWDTFERTGGGLPDWALHLANFLGEPMGVEQVFPPWRKPPRSPRRRKLP